MKKTNTARLFLVLALCAISSLCAIFGISLLNKTSAIAEGSATDVVSEGATVTYSEGGVTIASDLAYNGKINHTFKGDTTLKFKFPETNDSTSTWWDGNFVVRITDADDNGNYFEVKYSKQSSWTSDKYGYSGHTRAYVYYGSEVRTSQYDGNHAWYNSVQTNTKDICSPTFRNTSDNVGILKIIIDDNGVLSVRVNRHDDGTTMRTIAAFDGTESFENGTSWGLPKLNFTNGYKISFSSSFSNTKTTDKASDVLFKEIKDGDNTVEIKEGLITMADYVNSTEFFVTTSKIEQTTDGVRISSDTPYNATIKGVFKGDTTLKFKFPETLAEGETWYGGNFVVRVTDVDNDNNYFEVKYIADTDLKYRYTFAYVFYSDQVRTSKYYSSDGISWSNKQTTGAYALAAPIFLNDADKGTARDGELRFFWDNDKLSVEINNSHNERKRVIAAFDGTESFVSGTSWGLPKLSFKNGYKISFSSSFSNENTTDKATDVIFKQIINGNTYDLTGETILNDKIQEFDDVFQILGTANIENGKVFLGWKNQETGALYSENSIVKKANYEAVCISFDVLDGASIRIDTSENGKSGIRFRALFNPDEYENVKGYIQSFGMLVASTDTLKTTGKDFTIENYDGESTVKKVENTKGTFTFTYRNTKYTAYSMAIAVKEANYAKSYSARGYLIVEYADGSTQTIYTDYNEADNSRSIAKVAQILKENDSATYDGMTDTQKAIIDKYAEAKTN